MAEKNDKCYLDSDYKRCCCNCAYLLPVYFHYSMTEDVFLPVREIEVLFIGAIQKGWACVNPDTGVVYDGWPFHFPGCDFYAPEFREDS